MTYTPTSQQANPQIDAGEATNLQSNINDVALIFEGGAMRACCTAPVVVEFLSNGIFFNWVAGISAGTSNTLNYVSRDAIRARRSFVEFAAEPKFGGLQSFAKGQGLFNAKFIYQESGFPDAELPFDMETFMANPAQVRIGSYRADDGKMFYWGKEDITDIYDLMTKSRASSSLPFLMPPTKINGHTYVDGALGSSGGIALDAAKTDGFNRFVAILTRPRDFIKPAAKNLRVVRSYLRDYPAVLDGWMARPANYNRTREELFDLQSEGRAYLFMPEGFTVSNSQRNVALLGRSYNEGHAQIRRELPKIRDFLGLSYQ